MWTKRTHDTISCYLFRPTYMYMYGFAIGGNIAPKLRGREQISHTKISELGFFRKKFLFSRPKFLSHRPLFSDFFEIFHIFAACNVVYDPSFTRKPLFQK